MRCDRCGREIHSGEHGLFTTHDDEGGPLGTSAYPARRTYSSPLTLCEECAGRRDTTLKTFLWAVVLLVGGLIVVGLMIQIFG